MEEIQVMETVEMMEETIISVQMAGGHIVEALCLEEVAVEVMEEVVAAVVAILMGIPTEPPEDPLQNGSNPNLI